jgi:CheY-like chemotaxis protein
LEKIYRENDNHKFTILIAEDEETNYLFLEELISEMNIDILHAHDGEEAFELYANHPEIDLVFMDIKMPKMNGYEATKKMKELRPEVPVIMQTAYTLDANRQKALKANCNEFVSKPLTSRKVKLLLNKYLVEG